MSVQARLDFNSWYEAQFGKRPTDISLFAINETTKALEERGAYYRNLYEETQLWDRRYNDCLMAVNAAEHLTNEFKKHAS